MGKPVKFGRRARIKKFGKVWVAMTTPEDGYCMVVDSSSHEEGVPVKVIQAVEEDLIYCDDEDWRDEWIDKEPKSCLKCKNHKEGICLFEHSYPRCPEVRTCDKWESE